MPRRRKIEKLYNIVDNGEHFIIYNRENGDNLKIEHSFAKQMLFDFAMMLPSLRDKHDFRIAMARIRNAR